MQFAWQEAAVASDVGEEQALRSSSLAPCESTEVRRRRGRRPLRTNPRVWAPKLPQQC